MYYRIQSASNGREAWQKISELMPDIIVSDVMLPDMDGSRRPSGLRWTMHCNNSLAHTTTWLRSVFVSYFAYLIWINSLIFR
ncbi:response regulator [Bacillus cereus group sp. BC88]|uniref:response regulator n=1 Tax=Bacillus cereus group sp. BC88 TaxID=3445265 RepID=UPI003F29619C